MSQPGPSSPGAGKKAKITYVDHELEAQHEAENRHARFASSRGFSITDFASRAAPHQENFERYHSTFKRKKVSAARAASPEEESSSDSYSNDEPMSGGSIHPVPNGLGPTSAPAPPSYEDTVLGVPAGGAVELRPLTTPPRGETSPSAPGHENLTQVDDLDVDDLEVADISVAQVGNSPAVSRAPLGPVVQPVLIGVGGQYPQQQQQPIGQPIGQPTPPAGTSASGSSRSKHSHGTSPSAGADGRVHGRHSRHTRDADVAEMEEGRVRHTHHHRHHHGHRETSDSEGQSQETRERLEKVRQKTGGMPERRRAGNRESASDRRKKLVEAPPPEETKAERRKREKEEKKRAKQLADMQAIAEFEQSHNYPPVFIRLVTIINIALFAYSVYVNNGFEDMAVNPFFGPSVETLMGLGAKFGPAIRDGEWWRLFTAMFLHVGVIHLAMNMSFQVKAGMQLERDYGWHRIGIIYILSGLAGNLVSCLFLPKQVQVGASGALYGLLGVLLSDLIQNWRYLESPCGNLVSMMFTLCISFGMGLLPFVDNFAHVGGFICGVLAGVVFLPTIHFGFMNKTLMLLCLPGLIIYFVVLISVFYSGQSGHDWCEFCHKIDCIDAFFNCTIASYE